MSDYAWVLRTARPVHGSSKMPRGLDFVCSHSLVVVIVYVRLLFVVK